MPSWIEGFLFRLVGGIVFRDDVDRLLLHVGLHSYHIGLRGHDGPFNHTDELGLLELMIEVLMEFLDKGQLNVLH